MSILFRLHAKAINQFADRMQATALSANSDQLDLNHQTLSPTPLINLEDYRYLKPTEAQNQPEKSSTWKAYFDASTTTMIESIVDWEICWEKISASQVIGLDTETTGLDPHQSRPRFIQIGIPSYADDKKRICSDDFKTPNEGSHAEVFMIDLFKLTQEENKQVVSDVIHCIENPTIVTIFHNAAFDLKMLRSIYGKRFDCWVFDTMIASQLLSAGYFIPETQLEEWCAQKGFRCERQDKTVTITDEYTKKVVNLTKDNQKYYKPYYERHGLGDVAHRHLGIILDKTEQTAEWSGVVSDEMIQYAVRDVMVLLPLYEIQSRLIKLNQLDQAARIEFSCIGSTAEIEYVGMPFDSEKAQSIQAEVQVELEDKIKSFVAFVKATGFRPKIRKNRKAVDDEIQIQSNMEILQFMKYQAQKEGLWKEEYPNDVEIDSEMIELSTQKDTLSYLEARLSDTSLLKEAIQKLQAFRKMKKRMEFLDSYLSSINPETDRLHTSLQQLNPKGVGRFSSREPNMQQVGNDQDIRSLFASKTNVLVDADYSAIEMRIMAQLSNDPKLIEAFENQVDIHKYTAANIAGIPIDEVGKEQRQQSKAINFGLIYGMSAKTLKSYSESSYGVVMTDQEAEESRNGFFRVYNHIASWQDSQFKNRYSNEFVPYYTHDYKRGVVINELPGIRTLSGRLRVWPVEEKISQWGNPYSCKVGAITELYNSPDQGSGADILKLAMGWLFRELIKRNWDDVQIIMTIHDELLLECPPHKRAEVAELLSNVMELAASRFIKVIPVEVEAVVMEDWSGK